MPSSRSNAPRGRDAATAGRASVHAHAALGLALLSAVAAAPGAQAQAVRHQARPASIADSLRRAYQLSVPIVREVPVSLAIRAPGSSFGSPSAHVAASGDVFLATGYQHRTRYTRLPDGALVGGVGLGDPERWVAGEIGVASYSSVRRGFGSIGGASVKLARRIDRNTQIAAGYENLVRWGNTDGGQSPYVVMSTSAQLVRDRTDIGFGDMSVSLGMGSGRFQDERAALAARKDWRVFGSSGFRLARPVALALDWTGQDLNAGVTLTPHLKRAIVINMGFADLTHHAGDGPRFVMSVGYGMSLGRDRRIASPEDIDAARTPR